ncbi:TPA: rhodanese-related sulfurtransferase [Candidatus Woesearchaeota archaeon]|nr:rhodanese-related sulfurtransferase [Candidatus Woesearchaeota archaeon]
MEYLTISFYKYTAIQNPQVVEHALRHHCIANSISGRILLGSEGINGAVSGKKEDVQQLKAELLSIPLFSDLTFREQEVTSSTYHKLVIRIRDEIVRFGSPVDLTKRGKYVSPQELKQWYDKKEEFIIVDARNRYEFDVGRFKNAIPMDIQNFREFPQEAETLKQYQNKKIVLYCTGGIRCEKATAYLTQQGFPNVYHVQGGIINYVNELPNTYWEGGLFVFDDRLVLDLGEPLTNCQHCEEKNSQYINCHNLDCDKLFICCDDCQKTMKKTCSQKCFEAPQQREEKKRYETIGIIENYYPKAKTALINVKKPLCRNTTITIAGKTTPPFNQEINQIRNNRNEDTDSASAGEIITISVNQKVRRHDKIMLSY